MENRKLDSKVTPEVLQTILLDEISGRLAAIYNKLDLQRSRGNIYGIPVSASTIATQVVILHSATIINDGDADIYILTADRNIDSLTDVPLKKGEHLNLDHKERGAYTYCIKTLTGTATVRIIALA